ncbi:hypothetical protein [Aequorivita marina]|uniref:hypothetical protein n=1 Tax=Aequorivita marina TaxID=3073654 RepID=UPI002876E25F|nr:hypothetical protein [Aequorivita sp. S2608]MDS1297127.1 hypothetical protein [Aequorivita sp. S2608]
MKKIVTVFVFAITMILGVQTSSAQQLAQDNSRPEVIAKTKTAELTKTLDLTGDQSRTIFRALVAKEVGYQKSIKGKDLKSAAVSSEKKQLDANLDAAMKKTLNADQYSKWVKNQ